MNFSNLGWKIFGLLVSIFLIWGGLSGQMVLRGTDSSTALVVIGFLFLIWDIISIATHKKKTDKIEAVGASQPAANGLAANQVYAQPASANPQRPTVPPPPSSANRQQSAGVPSDAGQSPQQQAGSQHQMPPVPSNAGQLRPSQYKGIQWFFKALSQYADFSGRARRKEYWVTYLFTMVFSIAWQLVFFVPYIIINHADINEMILIQACLFFAIAFFTVMTLPSWAVAVRRLHDTGHSGWMMLVGLIPLIGGIWLLVLLFTDSQAGDNKYGPNPKTSPGAVSERARIRSAGASIIVASVMSILAVITNIISNLVIHGSVPMVTWNIVSTVVLGIILIAGIIVLNKKNRVELLDKGQVVFILLLFVAIIQFVGSVIALKNSSAITGLVGWIHLIVLISAMLLEITFGLFAATVLIFKKYQPLIRVSAVFFIVFAGLYIYIYIFNQMYWMQWVGMNGNNSVFLIYINLLQVLMPVAWIILAGTLLSRRVEQVATPVVYAMPPVTYAMPPAPQATPPVTYAMPSAPPVTPPVSSAVPPVVNRAPVAENQPPVPLAPVAEVNLSDSIIPIIENIPINQPAPDIANIPSNADILSIYHTPAVENTPVVPVIPAVEKAPVVPAAPVAQNDRIVPDSPVIEKPPVVPSAPAVENTPVVPAAPAVSSQRATVQHIVHNAPPKPSYYLLEYKSATTNYQAGELQKLSANQVEIGRDLSCEVRFDERFTTVSRRHAAIIKEDNCLKLVPISQTNSTFVNGIRVQKEWYLQHNDEIQFAINGPVLVFKLP